MVKLSVVINALNDEAYLWRCLKSLRSQEFQDFEIIVVDSGSSDRTVEVAKKMGARVLHEPGLGVNAIARNFGASEARGEIIAFTEAGSVCSPSWVGRIVKHFEDKKVVAVGGRVKPIVKNIVHRSIFLLNSYLFPWLASFAGFYAFNGANIAFRKKAFDKAGGFRESLTFIEENELPNRMKTQGKIVFDPSLVVFVSIREFEKKGYFFVARNCWKEYKKVYFS